MELGATLCLPDEPHCASLSHPKILPNPGPRPDAARSKPRQFQREITLYAVPSRRLGSISEAANWPDSHARNVGVAGSDFAKRC